MTVVRFYEDIEDSLLKFAVIITKYQGHWVFCKHKMRETLEVPGGHREPGETIEETARRELYEETGAIRYIIEPIGIYSMTSPDDFEGAETFGKLFYARVDEFEPELHSEIEKIVIMDELPTNWRYPDVYPLLLEFGEKRMQETKIWGCRVIEKALEYANFEWTPTEANVLHGVDEAGRFVDTPDVTWKGEELDCGWWQVGQVNIGIPYGWGNASTLEEFAAGLKEGKYAGNVPEDKSRYGSHNTVGVDCSGLLTRCWDLPKKIATRDIPLYAEVIELKEIRQGDVFAKVGSHVMFFKEFADEAKEDVVIIDATRSTGKVSQRVLKVEELLTNGYLVYRKKN